MEFLPRFRRHLRRDAPTLGLGALLLIGAVVADLAIPRMAQTLFDAGIVAQRTDVVWRVGLGMLAAALLSALLAAGHALLMTRVSEGLAADLRREVLARILTLSFGNLDRLSARPGLAHLTDDVDDAVLAGFTLLRWLQRVPLLMAGSLLLLLATSWQIALAMLLVMAGGGVLLWYAAARIQPLAAQAQASLETAQSLWAENLAGGQAVWAHGRQTYERARFEAAEVLRVQRSVPFEQSMAALLPSVGLVANLGLLVVLGLGGIRTMAGALTIGQMVACGGYIVTAMGPLLHLGQGAPAWSAALAKARRIREMLANPPDVAERDEAIALPLLQGRVALENVTFRYAPAGREPVLENINLVAEPGQTVAIVGPTGAGKSSLVNLIPRFYDVSVGRVTVDGIDVRAVTLGSLRSQVAVVAQEPALFTRSIRDNIAFGRPSASDDEVQAAAQAAQVDGFVQSLPLGYATQVGTRGVSLSAEQRRCVAIARALLTRPSVLILDDCARDLGAETMARLREALAAGSSERTCIITAQSLADVAGADQVVVLERGRIRASGTLEELLQASPPCEMAQAQPAGEPEKEGQA